MSSPQLGDFLYDFGNNALFSVVEPVVDLAIALREGGITTLSGCHVGNPVLYGDGSSEDNIDGVIGW
jgi:hypothetical protein